MRIDYNDPNWKYHSMLVWRRRAKWQYRIAALHVPVILGYLFWSTWWVSLIWIPGAMFWTYIARDSARCAAEREDWIVEEEMRKMG